VKSHRLNRLFHPDSGRCLNVAVDHGFFDTPGFLHGIEDMRRAVAALVEAGPDAIQLTTGMAGHLQSLRGRFKPSLVRRVDVANIYGKQLPDTRFSSMLEDATLQAVRLDAVCMCVNLFQIPGAPDVTAQCIDNILRLKTESDHYGMPMMVEPLVFQPNAEAGGYMVDGDPEKIIHLVRQAVELGADLIKADPTSRTEDYHRVVEAASGTPVLVRGGGRVSDREILERTAGLLAQGVHGIVYGRNVIQHPAPVAMTRALMAMLHEDSDVDEAMLHLA
jgi:fructose-bisphosphate aldolase, class I